MKKIYYLLIHKTELRPTSVLKLTLKNICRNEKKNSLLIILALNIFIISCGKDDPCDERYMQNDDGTCIPFYTPGIKQNLDLGNIFYHSKLGVITYLNGNWLDKNGLIIKNINN